MLGVNETGTSEPFVEYGPNANWSTITKHRLSYKAEFEEQRWET